MQLDNRCVQITEVQVSDFWLYTWKDERVYNGSTDHPFTNHGTMYKEDPCTTSVPVLIHQYFNYSSLALGQGFSFSLVNSYLNVYTHGASNRRPPPRFWLLAVHKSSHSVFDRLQYAKSEREGQDLTYGVSYHVICGTHDVKDSRHKKIFTFISPEKLEKQDKFQPRDKSYL